MPSDLVEHQVQAAFAAASDESIGLSERAEMLMEIAMGLQIRPKGVCNLPAAVELYEKGLELCPAHEVLLRARITARMGTALQAVAEDGTASLEQACDAYSRAIPVLREFGKREELAEAEMNLGLVLQSLASAHKANVADAISAYQRALRTFDRERYPQEFAILQNNLATAFLSMPFSNESNKMREALAVQAFEEGLKAVNSIDHPAEYAMLQNNLGNALQYVSSSHAVENNLRALDAYDEALKIRLRETMPSEFANTIANKANCLRNLSNLASHSKHGEHGNLSEACALYEEAKEIFTSLGDSTKAETVAEALFEVRRELSSRQKNEPAARSGQS